MQSRERLLATLRGEPTDHVPVYTQIPFVVTETGFKPGPIHGYVDHDLWREEDPAYWRLVKRMQAECDNFYFWRPPCMGSDQLFVPPASMETLPQFENNGLIYSTRVFRHAGRELRSVSAVKRTTGHTWQIEHWCKSVEDARALLDVSWEGFPPALDDFLDLQRWLGDLGLMWVTIPSPLLPVCRLFDPTEVPDSGENGARDLMHQLMRLAAERIRANLVALLDLGAGPIIRFGGAEHATPPLMSPKDFDDLVVAYDEPLMALCRKRGLMVAVHCHGRLRHALASASSRWASLRPIRGSDARR